MEAFNNRLPRLPPGFRFHPTDEELVVQYLKRKVHSYPLPASVIPDAHASNSDPWDLPGDWEQERFFFSLTEIKHPNGKRSNRTTPSGYWKATGLDKKILHSRVNQVVGFKKTLVFYQGKPPNGSRTNWVMHEYRLASLPPTQGMEKWVLCRIFLKKRGRNANKDVEEGDAIKPIFYDFMADTRKGDLNSEAAAAAAASSSSSSGSSGITNASHGTDEDEESSNII